MNEYIKKLGELITYYGGTRYRSTTADAMKAHIRDELLNIKYITQSGEKIRDDFLTKVDKKSNTVAIVTILSEEYMKHIGLGE